MAGGALNPQYAPIYVSVGHRYGIPPAVLAGLTDVETNGGANIATSTTGAQGLTQFEPATAAALHVNVHDPHSAIDGTARYLLQLGYKSNPLRALGAYNGGPGNPQYGYANQVMASARRLGPALAKYSGAAGVAMGKVNGTTTGATGGTTTTTTGGGPDAVSAGVAALLAGANRPIDPSGNVHEDNVVGRLVSNLSSGLYTTPKTTTTSLKAASAPAASSATSAFVARGRAGAYSGYVNPIPGAVLGRTDMGLDANLPAGHPIRAIGNSQVVSISPNWYKGQPYVLFKLLDGPKKGSYYYVAEAINPSVHAGQTVRAGQTVGTYNPGGTGLELGWGTPSGGRTLAQATSGYTEGQVTPSGVSFKNFLGTLK